jgi:hypothetical protein
MMGGTHMFLKEAYVHLFAEEGKERGKRGEREGCLRTNLQRAVARIRGNR